MTNLQRDEFVTTFDLVKKYQTYISKREGNTVIRHDRMKEEFAKLSKEQAQQVCKNIGQLAASLNVTHEAIATKGGFDRTAITRLFSGRYSPRLDIVLSVLIALGELSGKKFTLKDVDIEEKEVGEK